MSNWKIFRSGISLLVGFLSFIGFWSCGGGKLPPRNREHIELGAREQQADLSKIAEELCTERREFPLPGGKTCTIFFDPRCEAFTKDAAHQYEAIFREKEKWLGLPDLNLDIYCYFFVYGKGGVPENFRFEMYTPAPTIRESFIAIAPEASPQKAKADIVNCLAYQVADCTHNSMPLVANERKGILWFFEGLQGWLNHRLRTFLEDGAGAHETCNVEEDARRSFSINALHHGLWNFSRPILYCDYDNEKDLQRTLEKVRVFYEKNAELVKAAHGAVLWMEDQKPGAVKEIMTALYEKAAPKRRLVTPLEIFDAVKTVCGKDIRAL